MNNTELKDLKLRSIAKHQQVQLAMKKIEEDYITEHSPHRVGDLIKIGEKKVKNKTIDVTGYVYNIEVEYDRFELPCLCLYIYKEMNPGHFIKAIYI